MALGYTHKVNATKGQEGRCVAYVPRATKWHLC